MSVRVGLRRHPVQANLKNAVLQRAVFTRSDLGGAVVDGADFTNALLDKTQQMVRVLSC
jgi:uncharacterized protein YjbI with pentapeptide repeats